MESTEKGYLLHLVREKLSIGLLLAARNLTTAFSGPALCFPSSLLPAGALPCSSRRVASFLQMDNKLLQSQVVFHLLPALSQGYVNKALRHSEECSTLVFIGHAMQVVHL